MNNSITISNTGLITSFDAYLKQAYACPLLSDQEEHDLACKFYNEHDKESAHKLVFSHIKFVAKIARNYQNIGLNMSDLIQEGTVGLMKAVQNFNPYHGVRLASFALHWIKSEIHEFILKNWSLVKIATTKSQRKIFFNLNKFNKSKKFFSSDDIKKISEFLNVPIKDVNNMVQRMAHKGDVYTEDTENQDMLLFDNNSNHAATIEENDWQQHQQLAVQNAIEALDERSRTIIQERWLSEEKKTSLKDLSKKLNISLVRVSQIEKQAIEKMKTTLREILKIN